MSQGRVLRAVFKDPGEQPVVGWITDRLEEYQAVVGGPIELVALDHCVIIVNEEGKLRGMRRNFPIPRDIIVGPAVFIGVDGDEFDDITDAGVEEAMALVECRKGATA